MAIQRQRLLEAWNDYAARVLPKEAGDVQRLECRRAFYAGAVVTYGAIIKPEDEEEIVQTLADIGAELQRITQGGGVA